MYNVHSRSSSRHDRRRRILSADVWAYLEGVHWYLSVGSGSDELDWQGKSAATYSPMVWHCTIIGLWSVSRSDGIVLQCHYQRGRAHNGNAIGLPIRLESPWRPCCEILCHCQRTFQPAPWVAEQTLQVADNTRCILSSQMTPNWKPFGPAVNEQQIVSALVVGYIHSYSRPRVTNVQLPSRPTRGL